MLAKKACWSGICMTFNDLNDVYPKDYFPLPIIDKLFDVTIGFCLMIFLNAYSNYHQIRIHLEDEEKTSFITKEYHLLHQNAFWVNEYKSYV